VGSRRLRGDDELSTSVCRGPSKATHRSANKPPPTPPPPKTKKPRPNPKNPQNNPNTKPRKKNLDYPAGRVDVECQARRERDRSGRDSMSPSEDHRRGGRRPESGTSERLRATDRVVKTPDATMKSGPERGKKGRGGPSTSIATKQ